MKRSMLLILALALPLLVLVAACGSDDNAAAPVAAPAEASPAAAPEPAPDPAREAPPEPTPEPAPDPAPEPSPEPAPEPVSDPDAVSPLPEGPIDAGTYKTTAGFLLTFADDSWNNWTRLDAPGAPPEVLFLKNRDVAGSIAFHEVTGVLPPGAPFPNSSEAREALELPEDLAAWVAEHPDLTITETTEAEDGSTVFVLETSSRVQFLCDSGGCFAVELGEIAKLTLGSRDGVESAIWIVSEADTYEAFEAKADAVVSTLEPAESAPEPATAEATGTLTFDGESCIYEGPQQVPAGPVTFIVANSGSSSLPTGYIVLIKEGGAVDAYAEFLVEQSATPAPDRQAHDPDYVETIKQVEEPLFIGRSGELSASLDPGTYVLVCDAGFVAIIGTTLEVTASQGAASAEGAEAPAVAPLAGGPITPDSLVRLDPVTGEITAAVAVGATPFVAVGEQAVLTGNQDDGTVSIVDPDTVEVVATVPVEGVPRAVAIAGDVAWVTSLSGERGTVSRIDLTDGSVLNSAAVDSEDPRSVLATDDALWIAGQDPAGNAILRVDPVTLETVTTIPTAELEPFDVVLADGAVWYAFFSDGDPKSFEVWRIDPGTDAVEAKIEVPAGPVHSARVRFSAAPEGLWVIRVRSIDHTLINTTANEIDHSVVLPSVADVNECGVFANDALWFAVRDGSLFNTPDFVDSYQLRTFDPETGEEITRFTVGEDVTVTGLATSPDAIWLAASADTTSVGC